MTARPTQKPLTIFDILVAIYRYKWRAMFVTLVVLTLSIAVILLLPRKYESEAQMFVRLGRSSAGMDPAAVGSMISIQESRETEMTSIMDMLQSRGLADEIVDAVGEDRILQKTAWAEVKIEELMDFIGNKMESFLPSDTENSVDGAGVSEHKELAVGELMSNLKISSPRKSTTLSVVYRARDPALAFEVVQTLIDKYQQMHVKSTSSRGAVDFFSAEFSKHDKELKEAEEALRVVKNEASMLTLGGKQSSLQQEQDAIKQMLLQTTADHSAVASRVKDLESSIAQLPDSLNSESTSGIEQGASDTMRDRLYELEIKERDLAARLGGENPQLKTVRKQIDEARKILAEQPTERKHQVTAMNPVKIELQKNLYVDKATAISLTKKLEELHRMDEALQVRIEKINLLQLHSDELQRKIETARENYGNYARKLEEARISSELDRVALSNVSVVTPPVIRWKPVSPKRSLLAVAAAFFSALLGISVAMFSDYLTRSRVEQVGRRNDEGDRETHSRVRRRVDHRSDIEDASELESVERRALPR